MTNAGLRRPGYKATCYNVPTLDILAAGKVWRGGGGGGGSRSQIHATMKVPGLKISIKLNTTSLQVGHVKLITKTEKCFGCYGGKLIIEA